MPKLHLNEKAILRMKAPHPSGMETIYWDAALTGFGVLCSKTTNRRMYVVQRAIIKGGKPVRHPFAAVNEIPFKEAKDRAKGFLDGMRKGIDPRPSKRKPLVVTLQSWLERYIEVRNLRPDSVRMYRQIERTLKDWMNLPLHEITGDMVEAKHRELARIVGKTTANFAMRTLGIIWNFAADRVPGLEVNPVRRLKRQWYPEPRRTRHVTPEQLPAFYRAVMELDPIVRDYVLLLLFTGMRRGETLSLRWENVDFGAKLIRVPARATKNGRNIDVPMSDYVLGLLLARWNIGNAGGYVLPSPIANKHLTANVRCWSLIKGATGGVKMSAHDMRRTFSTVAQSAGIQIYHIKQMLNHSTGSDVTLGYIIQTPEDWREIMQKVAAKMLKLCNAEVVGENVVQLEVI